MDEYQFQHEDDPALKKAATDAVNRTLWLQHWKNYRASFKGQLFIDLVALMMVGLLAFIPLPSDGLTIIMTLKAWLYALMPFGLLWLAGFATALRKGEQWRSAKIRQTLKRPRSVMVVAVILCYASTLFNLATHSKAERIWVYLPAFIFIIGWDWYQLRKLRKNLISWGVLEADGSPPLLEDPPVVAQLEKAEQQIDVAFGSSSHRSKADESAKQKITM